MCATGSVRPASRCYFGSETRGSLTPRPQLVWVEERPSAPPLLGTENKYECEPSFPAVVQGPRRFSSRLQGEPRDSRSRAKPPSSRLLREDRLGFAPSPDDARLRPAGEAARDGDSAPCPRGDPPVLRLRHTIFCIPSCLPRSGVHVATTSCRDPRSLCVS